MFAKLKHWMRVAQKRSINEVWQQVAKVLHEISNEECANYFRNAGYASVKT